MTYCEGNTGLLVKPLSFFEAGAFIDSGSNLSCIFLAAGKSSVDQVHHLRLIL